MGLLAPLSPAAKGERCLIPRQHARLAEVVVDGLPSLFALNARGICTARGGRWHVSTLQNLLRRAAVLS
jgi:hypothetical protein